MQKRPNRHTYTKNQTYHGQSPLTMKRAVAGAVAEAVTIFLANSSIVVKFVCTSLVSEQVSEWASATTENFGKFNIFFISLLKSKLFLMMPIARNVPFFRSLVSTIFCLFLCSFNVALLLLLLWMLFLRLLYLQSKEVYKYCKLKQKKKKKTSNLCRWEKFVKNAARYWKLKSYSNV